MLPVLRLGPFVLPAGPVSVLAAYYLAIEIGDTQARRLGLRKNLISNTGFIFLAAGLIAARLGYVIRNVSAYQFDWSQILALNLGTLDVTIGIAVGLLVSYIYLSRQATHWALLLDAVGPALALALAVVSLGNFLTGDAYGTATSNLPCSIFLWGELRHPVQIYEALADLGIFFLIRSHSPRARSITGAHFLLTLSLLAGARLVLEPFRGDSVPWVFGLRSAQVLALTVMTISTVLLVRGGLKPLPPVRLAADKSHVQARVEPGRPL